MSNETADQVGTVAELIDAIHAEGPVSPNMRTALDLLQQRTAWMEAKGRIAVDIANEPVAIDRMLATVS